MKKPFEISSKAAPSPHYLDIFSGDNEITLEDVELYEKIHASRVRRSEMIKRTRLIQKRLEFQTTDKIRQRAECDLTIEDVLDAQSGRMDAAYRTRTPEPIAPIYDPISTPIVDSITPPETPKQSPFRAAQPIPKRRPHSFFLTKRLAAAAALAGIGLTAGIIYSALTSRAEAYALTDKKPVIETPYEKPPVIPSTPEPSHVFATPTQKMAPQPYRAPSKPQKKIIQPAKKTLAPTQIASQNPYTPLSCVRYGMTQLPWDIDINGWDRCHQITGGRESIVAGGDRDHDALDIWGQKGKQFYFVGYTLGETAVVTRVVTPDEAKHSTDIKIRNAGSIIEYQSSVGGKTLERKIFHSQKIFVREGDVLRKGTLLGEVGKKGRATGPHVHYEVRLNGKSIYLSELERRLEKEFTPIYVATLQR